MFKFLCTILVGISVLIAGCRPEERGRLTFAVGGAPSELAFWTELIDDFRRETGIEVDLLRQSTDSDQRRQGLVVPLHARQADPDVFLMDVVWLAQFTASEWLQPLDERMERTGPPEDVFFESILEMVDRHRGALMALPVYVDGGLLYYRRDLLIGAGFSGPPQTWSELVAQARHIQQVERRRNPGFYGYVWQGAQYEGLICNFLEVAASGGGGILDSKGEIALDRPENGRALQLMRDFIHLHRISPENTYTQMQEEEVRELFQRGNALFERNWPYAWVLHQRPESPVRDKVGIAPLPRFSGGRSVSTLGGWHIGISRFSDAGETAWELIRYILSAPVQKRLAIELGWNPGRRDLYQDPEILEALPHFVQLREIFDQALARPVLPYYSQISAVLQRHLNAALADRSEPEEALRSASAEARRISERYRPQ